MYFRTNKKAVDEYKIGGGWPEYRNVTVNEIEQQIKNSGFAGNDAYINENMQNEAEVSDKNENTLPRYSAMPGNSTYSSDNAATVRDRELMKQLYTNVNKIMMPYVVRVVAELDYVGSPIYAEEGIDRETLAQLTGRVLDLAQMDIDEIEEIRTEADPYPMEWNRRLLIKNLTESLVLCHIFNDKRPRYRAISENYNY